MARNQRTRRVWAGGIAGLGVIVLFVAFVGLPFVKERSLAHRDASASAEIVRRFPLYPGAMEDRRFTDAIHKSEDSGVVVGHTMTVEYRLPAGSTPPQVFAFYGARLPAGWRPASNDRDCPPSSLPPPPPSAPSAQGARSPQPTSPPSIVLPGTLVPMFLERPLTHRDFLAENRRDAFSLDVTRPRPTGDVMLEMTAKPYGGVQCTSQPDGGPDPFAGAFP